MKQVIKLEFERAFRSRGMTLSLIIGYSIAVIHFIKYVLPKSQNILRFFDGMHYSYLASVFNTWLGIDVISPWLNIYMTIFPILAVLPYGASWFEDKRGYIRSIVIRTDRTRFLLAKYFAVFVSGGIVVILPMLLNLMLTASVLPSLLPSMNGLFPVSGGGMFAGIFYTRPYLYIGIYLIMYFVYGGVFASLALAAAIFINNRYFVLLVPFMCYYGTGMLTVFINNPALKELSLIRVLNMTQYRSISEYTFFGEAVVWGALGIIIYMTGGRKNDIF